VTGLSKHFALAELTRSSLAVRRGIDNTPDAQTIDRLRALCVEVLEPVRRHFGRPLRISSGYRCAELNALVGGAPDSQHARGEAADFEVDDASNLAVARFIAESTEIAFDQVILEFHVPGDPRSGWVHVSHRVAGNRRQVLTASRDGGAIRYAPGLP